MSKYNEFQKFRQNDRVKVVDDLSYLHGQEGRVVGYIFDGEHVAEVVFDGQPHGRQIMDSSLEPVEDPYEYGVEYTYLFGDRRTTIPEWTDKGTAERFLADHEEIYAEMLKNEGVVHFSSKIVKRRKAGKVEEA